MGKRTPSAPAAPDPVATANAQGNLNRQNAIFQQRLNMMDQDSPFGSLRFNQTGTWDDGTPRYTATQALTPEMQRFVNTSQNLSNTALGNAAGAISRPFSINEPVTRENINRSYQAGLGRQGEEAGIQHWLNSGLNMRQIDEYIRNQSPESRQFVQGGGQQTAVDFQNNLPGRINSLDLSNLPGLASQANARNQVRYDLDFSAFGDPNISRDRVENALLQRMNPQLEQDRQRLETQLANQGIGIGSAAYNAEMDRLGRATNDARLAAILNAGQEQSRLFGLGLEQGRFFNQAQGQDFGQSLSNANLSNAARAQGFNERLSAANFQNQQRQNAINEQLMERQLPLNELAAVMGGSQVQSPGFINSPVTQVQAADISGPMAMQYQGQLAGWNAQNQANNAMMGGLFGLGSALGGGYLASGGRFF